MTVQFSVAVRDAQLDSFESTAGTSAILHMYVGGPPANCAAPSTGTVLVSMTLPVDWMNAAAGGQKTINGTWEDLSADASGLAGYFRIFDSTDTTCHMQGTITATGGGGDMELDNPTLVAGQDVKVSTFTLTAGNA